MKRIIALTICIILVGFVCNAQRDYSKQTLEQADEKELSILLKNAKTNQTFGMIFTLVGSASVGSMFILNEALGGISFETAGILFFGGSFCFLIGLPIYIVNSLRISKIKNINSYKSSIEIIPYRFQNSMAQVSQSGLSIVFKF